ncbi:MAG: dipeptidase [Schwartzia succinivorans]|uniref:dipeptidase n=1 Tax=Schwartzia succinivorans TaxID=55507 RepID=UPI002352EC3E|nr:C69 family dipeptidase [Schwartzia succinivorans]MBE6096502.1 dipeptidase [Schwartzia succinivorans]
MLKKLVLGLMMFLLLGECAEACTVIVVTKGASADGSVMVSHSNDGYDGEVNLAYVPAKDHPAGSMRPVYASAAALGAMPEYNTYDQPNLVAPERGADYDFPDRPRTRAIGYIPEIGHTYAYLDADYGIVNEHGLMMGECTDMSAHLPEVPFKEGGGIFYASELSRVALERCRTAREAVELMGALIDEYGLWGSGETLAVADREEAWVFEMQMSPTGKGGFWIAEKIPDGDFFIAASQFRIRGIREGDSNQIFNPNLPQMLKDAGWAAYDEEGRVDWVKSLQSQEFYHPYYSKRRVWRGMSLVAPSKKFPSRVGGWDEKTYPFSVRPDKKLNIEDVARIYRDYYQGTEFDKTKTTLAGMYGSPYHYASEIGERPFLSSNTSYTHISQVSDALPSPVVWMSMNTPYENPFVPFAVSEVPKEYRALRDTYDSTKMYWTSNEVMALTQGYFNIMSPIVRDAVERSEANSVRLINASSGFLKEQFADALRGNALKIFEDWKELSRRLMMKFNAAAGVKYERLPAADTPKKY